MSSCCRFNSVEPLTMKQDGELSKCEPENINYTSIMAIYQKRNAHNNVDVAGP